MESEGILLYENLTLLCNFREPSKNLKEVLKLGMFDNPNKTGMLHTLHFLLPIFKSDIFKTTIVWPVCTVKDEADFRAAVKKFIAEYNSTHKLFELPKILPSLLLSAGGAKFISFMRELSTAALMLILQKDNKDAHKACVNFKTLSETDQVSVYSDLQETQDIKSKRYKKSSLHLELLKKDADKGTKELEEECNNVTNQLMQAVTESQYFSSVDKKSLLDIEDMSCIDKHIRELDKRESDVAVKMQQTSNFKEIFNNLSVIVQRMVLLKDKRTVLDGSAIIPDEFLPIVDELTKENWLNDSVSLYENGNISLMGLMKFCDAGAKQQLNLLQQMIVKFKDADTKGMSERLETSLKQLRSLNLETLNLKLSMEEKLRALAKLISDVEEVLFDFDPDPRFQNLVAPSPRVTMPSLEAKEDDDNAVYESYIDSPFVKNFARNLIEKIKADSKRNSNCTTDGSPFNGRPNFSSPTCHSSPIASKNKSNLLHRRNLCGLTKPFSHANNNGSFLNQSMSLNSTCKPESPRLSSSEISESNGSQTPSTPVQNDNANHSLCTDSSNPINTGEGTEKEIYSPRGIFKLTPNSNYGDEVDAELEKLSEHFVPKTPMHRRQSFLNLMERYQRVKLLSTANQFAVNESAEDVVNGSGANEDTLNGNASNEN